MNTNLIGISGKIGSGKDTVARIIQYLSLDPEVYGMTNGDIIADLEHNGYVARGSHYKVKKFAGKLKQIASLLTGIPVEKFEDQEFKKEYLGEEWNYYTVSLIMNGQLIQQSGRFVKKEEAEAAVAIMKESFGTLNIEYVIGEQRMTVRQLLQELGTEVMRKGLHENVWVNALMADYRFPKLSQYNPSHWIVTDVRFPNEAQAIQDQSGLLLRIERPGIPLSDHASETALDEYPFMHVIVNDGDLNDLINKVRKLMTELNIIEQ
jgi:uncharacterized protein YegP (UPF0339 family)